MNFKTFLTVLQYPLLALAKPSQEISCPPGHVTPIDLGYAKHIPTYTNTTASGLRIHIYKNIRFAHPPKGPLRFRRPLGPANLPTQPGVQDGKAPWAATDCIASAPSYVPFPGINGTTWGHEDCLFLDVYVPEDVKPGDSVPVLHNFFGSAYAFGSKDILFEPMGLFEQMHLAHGGRFIFVANNYRLGMPGWTYAQGQDMDANVGMYDCIAAAEWTAAYIHKFGGDGQRITAIGQSAGAGMLYYMTVLDGGRHKLPFQQAWISSPAAPPRRSAIERQKKLFELVLETANCKSLDCLRSIPEETMRHVNDQLINHMPSNTGGGVIGPVLGFGPAPDGNDITDIPLELLREGKFNRGLKRLVLGSMLNEGMGTSSDEGMPARFPFLVRMVLPSASNETVADIQAGYQHLSQPAQLAWDWTTDAIFACNAYNLAKAMPERVFRYVMSEPPAVHGQDVNYFFYVDAKSTPVTNVELAREMQNKLLRFLHGEELDWPACGRGQEMFNISGILRETKLPVVMRERCETVKRVVLDPANGA